jgi:hypothetical protein
MNLAGEAGSLLKIEEEIESTVAQARAQWQREFEQATDRSGNELLLTHSEMDRLSSRANAQMDLFDVSQVTDEEFWAQAEGRVIEALRSYSAGAANGESYQRKLFADDAAQGFAFVDICRKRFDVVLMNPPLRGREQTLQGLHREELPPHQERRLRRIRRARPGLVVSRRPARSHHLPYWLLPLLLPQMARGDSARRSAPDCRRGPRPGRAGHRDGRDRRLRAGESEVGWRQNLISFLTLILK